MIPIHPQPVAGDPQLLRWVIPAGVLSVAGPLVAVPAPLAALLADSTLVEVVAEPAAVLTRLGRDRRWSVDGARVRTAVHAALGEPAAWSAAGPADLDAPLRTVAQQLLDGAMGEFARSHGGGIELRDVRDGVVTVRLVGACHGCPAARVTLHQRLERALRRRCPALRAVVSGGARSSTEPAAVRRLPGLVQRLQS